MKKIITTLLILMLVSTAFGVARARALRHFYNLTVDNNITIDGILYTDEITEATSGSGITFNSDAYFDKIETAADAGFVNMINHPLSTSSAKEGGSLSIGSSNLIEYYGTGNGAGGITKPTVGLKGAVIQETYVIRKVVSQTGLTDATATNAFTITTVTTEFGGYICKMSVLAGDDMVTGNANTAVMGLEAHFSHVIENSGNTATSSAVAEISQTASANEGTGAVTDITMTVVATSEVVRTIQADVNVSAGGVADVIILIELIYWDLATAPVIAAS